MRSLDSLERNFAIPGRLGFSAGADGLVFANLTHVSGEAQLCLQGGHLFSWNVQGLLEPVLWLSRDAKFAAGKSIRGGIPVCWPWFGPHSSDATFPAHGFARTATWEVVDASIDESGNTCLVLTVPQSAMPTSMWPHATAVQLTVRVGTALQMSLTTRNDGSEPYVLGEALHTYFNISDIARVSVGGLEGVEYWDTVGQLEKKRQSGSITFDKETDRVYIDSAQVCVIEDPGYARRIHISKQGSLSTVVWNPWTAKAERMGDLGKPDGWRQMLCVESANAWDNKLTLAPGESHTLSVEYRVEPF